MVRLSFIIATYNRANDLIRTLNTLAHQSLSKALFEVVVADNNSVDSTHEAFHSFAERNTDMNLVYVFEQRQGLSWARNCAMARASGDIFVIVDDDELIDAWLAQVYLEFFDTMVPAAAAGGVVLPVYGCKLPSWFSPYINELISGAFWWGPREREFSGGRYPRGGNFAIRRSMIKHYGNFNTDLGRKGKSVLGGEEKDLLRRLSSAGEKIYYLPGAVIKHVIPNSKVTVSYFNRLTRMIGISERVRTLNLGRGALSGRLAVEALKWGGATLLFFYYMLTLRVAKGWFLLKMRWNITGGLLGLFKM